MAPDTSTSPQPLLAPAQRRAVAVGLTVLSVAATLFFTGLLMALVVRFCRFFSGVFLPLAVAGILALILKPYYARLRRMRLTPIAAVAIIYATLLVPLALFLWFFGSRVFAQLVDLVTQLPAAWQALQRAIDQRWPAILSFWQEHALGTRLANALRQHGDWVASVLDTLGGTAWSAGQSVGRLVAATLSWLVLPVYLALLLMGEPLPAGRLEAALPFLKPDTRRDVLFLAQEFVTILVSFFRGQLLIAVAQGVMLGLGFALVGLSYGLTLGLVFGFLNIVPFLGSMLTLVVTLPLAMLQPGGGTHLVLMVLGVIMAVQLIEAYVLTPRIMGSRTGLPPLAIIVAIFFWGTALDGLAGMILAIPLTAFLVVFWRLAKTRYVRPIL
ncbi:MAG: AI-2E family transporter [Lentisphaerae bacterium]|nr:AI-2E family transporter [Lentisphaerota bacterium]